MRKLFYILFFVSRIASAQVTDNFTDGDFTASPVWTGDGSEFQVNASFQLQLNNSIAGASYLSTPSPSSSLDNMEWRFYVKQAFAPSSTNYGRVYLASDQANLEGSLNGYYLQFGEALSLDAVELFRQTGLVSTSVARGTNGEIAASFAVGVKVTRDALGNWNLYVDPTGGAAYGLEATGTDLTYTTTSFFGVADVYSVSNATKFYYDDVYNGAIVVDVTAPSIVSSTVISSTQVDVLFNENVDLTTSQTLTNYSADNALGNPSVAMRDASNHSLVHLTWATTFTNALLNTLTVNNVQDLSANAITSANATFTYFAPVVAAFKDVIITELMADETPQVGLPLAEFIEIHNRSTSNTFNLNGWQLSDASGTATLGNYNLSPNSYLILCANADTALFSPFGNTLGVTSFPSLLNSGELLGLKDNLSTQIDSVTYSISWYQDGTKDDGGWTLELINPNYPVGCPASGNWIASNNVAGGTPGIQNSVYSIAPDVTAPTISSVTVIDSTHITVCFSEAVDASQIVLLTNYSINNGIGNPISATANASLSCVDFVLSTSLSSSITYTLTVSNMADCSGNVLSPTTATFNYYKVKPFDIVINELMVDPDPQLIGTTIPDVEYAELYNRTSFPINLNNWILSIGATDKILPNVIIPADSFVVIASSAAVFLSSVNVAGVSSLSLTNTGATVTLKTPAGSTISTISYDDTWYQDAVKKDGGWSIEQIDPNNPCAGMSNWRASNNVNGGTPGFKNSIYASNSDITAPQVLRVGVNAIDTIQLYFNEPLDSTTMLLPSLYTIDNSIGNPTMAYTVAPDFKSVKLALGTALTVGVIYTVTVNNTITDCVGNPLGLDNSARFAVPQTASANDIVINEILFDPNTGGVDFVEIYNRSNKVIDLKPLYISEYDTILNTPINYEFISTDGYLIFPGDYVVLSENGNAVKSQYTTTNPEGFLDVATLPDMNNDGGTVCLSSVTTIIDNFKYDPNMHYALLNVTKGVTLERIDFERPTQDRTNWHSAAQDIGYGTPAYKNSQYHDAGETDNAIEITPEIFSPNEDGASDVVNINYHFTTPGFTANITIYDSKGRLVRNLIRNELLGINGTFSWDGINEEREKARIGIYVIFVEVFDLDGNVKHYKKTCVLASKL